MEGVFRAWVSDAVEERGTRLPWPVESLIIQAVFLSSTSTQAPVNLYRIFEKQ